MNLKKIYTIFSFLLIFAFVAQNALAHHPDHSYLYLRIYKDAFGGRVEINVEDMNRVFGYGFPDSLTMKDLEPHITDIQNYIKDGTQFSANGKTFPIKFSTSEILNLGEEIDIAQFNFDLQNVDALPDDIDIYYSLILDKISKHRAPLIVEYNFKAGVINNYGQMTDIFTPNRQNIRLSLTDTSIWKGFWALIKLGVWHIWIGLDHILFILALILPSVVRRDDSGKWRPVPEFGKAFWYILKIITFFTIAHSITLAIAAMGWIDLPSHIVEAIIAISIALAALHNIIPILKHKEWMIAFGFGLFHGFGFASVLGEKGLGGDYLIPSLLGFNVGVEVGQVLIICMIFPILFLFRKTKYYPPFIKYGSMLLIIISIYWFIERFFQVDLTAGTYFWQAYHAILG